MSRKCAVCGEETRVLRNEHHRVVDFRLCGGKCREEWFARNKREKAHGIQGVQPSFIVYDEFHDVGDPHG